MKFIVFLLTFSLTSMAGATSFQCVRSDDLHMSITFQEDLTSLPPFQHYYFNAFVKPTDDKQQLINFHLYCGWTHNRAQLPYCSFGSSSEEQNIYLFGFALKKDGNFEGEHHVDGKTFALKCSED